MRRCLYPRSFVPSCTSLYSFACVATSAAMGGAISDSVSSLIRRDGSSWLREMKWTVKCTMLLCISCGMSSLLLFVILKGCLKLVLRYPVCKFYCSNMKQVWNCLVLLAAGIHPGYHTHCCGTLCRFLWTCRSFLVDYQRRLSFQSQWYIFIIKYSLGTADRTFTKLYPRVFECPSICHYIPSSSLDISSFPLWAA